MLNIVIPPMIGLQRFRLAIILKIHPALIISKTVMMNLARSWQIAVAHASHALPVLIISGTKAKKKLIAVAHATPVLMINP